MLISDDFRAYFGRDELDELDREACVIYGLDRNLRLALLNEAWFDFARENDASEEFYETFGLGASYLDSLPEPVRGFFEDRIRKSMATGKPWAFEYLCPSADLYRKLRMQVLPLPGGAGCLVSNATIVEIPHPQDFGADLDVVKCFTGEGGMVTQCCHCRRTRRVDDPARWDWLPQFLHLDSSRVSHGICPTCYAYFYPSVDRS